MPKNTHSYPSHEYSVKLLKFCIYMKSIYIYDRNYYIDSVLLQYDVLLWARGSAVSGGGQ